MVVDKLTYQMVNQKKWSLVVMNTANASLNTQKAWNTINWAKVQRKVFKLQTRILRAVQSGQKAKARKLQQLLLKSHSAKLLALRQTLQDGQTNNSSVHDKKVIFNDQLMALVNSLTLKRDKTKSHHSLSTVKSPRDQKFFLRIKILRDKAMQTLLKLALEPYWEGRFRGEFSGFSLRQSSHDAIEKVFQGVAPGPKYVFKGKIVNCFDQINQGYLVSQLDCPKTIKLWLKAGIIDDGLSPFLVNIALERMSKEAISSGYDYLTFGGSKQESEPPILIRYMDNFVILHQKKEVIVKCQTLIRQWLKKKGFRLSSETTRISNTLYDLEIDGKQEKAGFDFIGFNIRQYPRGKHHSPKNGLGECLPYQTLIKPSQKSIQAHYQEIVKVVNNYKHAPQRELIRQLNPIIQQWSDYYSRVSSYGVFSKLDQMIASKLRAWIKTRTGGTGKTEMSLYFRDGVNASKTFQTKEGYYLVTHRQVGRKKYVDLA